MNRENQLVIFNGRETVTTSLKVAEIFNKRHDDVLKAIRSLIADLSEEADRNFAVSEYTDSTGRKLPMYEMTRDGFSLLAMGFTGKKALDWKLQFLKAFNLMEQSILNQQNLSWPEAIKVFQSFHGVAKLIGLSKQNAALSANAAAKNQTGVDLLGLMEFDQGVNAFQNTTLLNGLEKLMDTDNLVIRDTFKGLLARLDLIVSPDSNGMSLPTPRTFRLQLERLRPKLQPLGISFEFGRHTNKGLTVEIVRMPVAGAIAHIE